MDRSTPIYLIRETFTEDEYGVLQPRRERRLAYANVTSVSASEWFEGGRNGLNPELRVIMFGPDYHGEEVVEIGGKTYSIYRTYTARTDVIELYVQRRKGDDNHGESQN